MEVVRVRISRPRGERKRERTLLKKMEKERLKNNTLLYLVLLNKCFSFFSYAVSGQGKDGQRRGRERRKEERWRRASTTRAF